MSVTDDMKNKFHDMGDDMRERYEELKSREMDGDLDDHGREELNQLRTQFEDREST